MTEDFVSFDLAKKLEAKGFKWEFLDMKKYIIRIIVAIVIIYLAYAFLVCELDPSKWAIELREECAGAMVMVAGIVAILQYALEEG